MKKLNVVSIHTDGSASIKASNGGWAFVAKYRGERFERYGFADEVTNNQMELMAVIRALEFIQLSPQPLRFYVDSQYVVNAVNVWMSKWKREGWRGVFGEPVKNIDLMQRLDELLDEHREHRAVTFAWVEGHAGNKYNEIADRLAGDARKQRLTNWLPKESH